MPRHKEHSLSIRFPRKHSDILRIPTRRFIFCKANKILEQESSCRLDTVTLKLPEPDLVDHSRRKDRGRNAGLRVRSFGDIVLAHLRMCMRGYVRNDLVCGDTHFDGAADRLAGDLAGY